MVMCSVPQCRHYNHKNKCRFLSFPRDPHQLKRWTQLIRKSDEIPSVHARVCSCHFKDGRRENGPTIFSWNQWRRATYLTEPLRRQLDLGSPDDPSANLEPTVRQPIVIIVSCKNKSGSKGVATSSYHHDTSLNSSLHHDHHYFVSEDMATGSHRNESVSEDMATGSNHNDSVSEDLATSLYNNELVSEVVATGSYHNDSVSEDIATNLYNNELVFEDVATGSNRNSPVSKDMATGSNHYELVLEDMSTGSNHNDTVSEDVATSLYNNEIVSEDMATGSNHNDSVSKDMVTGSNHNYSVSKDMATGSNNKTDSCQCRHTLPASVEAELYFLRQEVEILKQKLKTAEQKFSLKLVMDNDKKVKMYTGFPSASTLKTVFNLLEEAEVTYSRGWNVTKYTREEQIFITLMKLRMNLPHYDLAVRWNCSHAMISNIFLTWLNILHSILYEQKMGTVPTQKENQSCLAACFIPCTASRISLDCTKMSREESREFEKRKKSFSKNEKMSTLKGLVGVTPNGVVTFLSDLYPGSTSDEQIIQNSSETNVSEPGDLTLADNGFLIRDIPPFLNTPQFTPEQSQKTKTTARARVHVETAIARIRMYKILDLIPATLAPYSSKVWQVCGALTNYHNPVITEVEGSMDCEENSGSVSEDNSLRHVSHEVEV